MLARGEDGLARRMLTSEEGPRAVADAGASADADVGMDEVDWHSKREEKGEKIGNWVRVRQGKGKQTLR